jgi:hypothetical protein
LSLPDLITDIPTLFQAVLHTNRAPLVLAFALTLLKYTMPSQPLSSRLSLAQAVVSLNSRTKAVSLGIESGQSAEEEGWGQGQPVVRIMGRDVRVMRRWGYIWRKEDGDGAVGTQESEATLKAESQPHDAARKEKDKQGDEEPPLWAIDLEALKNKNAGDHAAGPPKTGIGLANPHLPIYTPQSARSYLLRAFESPAPAKSTTSTSASPKKKSAKNAAAEKERNLGMLLGALEVVFKSWAGTLENAELDRRAWSWYIRVRPEVKEGVAGWGGRGDVRLADILALRRE